jgi:Bacterial Ig-like domain/Bacterial Ig domain
LRERCSIRVASSLSTISPRPTDLSGLPDAGGGDGSDIGAVEFQPSNAVADSYATDEDTPLNVPASGVLANDMGGEGGPLTASMVSGPDHGELSLQAGGSFTYTPDAGYVGSDSFTYKTSDGTLESGTATVTIEVHDATAPTIVGKSPRDMNVSPNTKVKVTFSEEMDKDTLVTDQIAQASTTFVLVKKGASRPIGTTVVAVENAAGGTVAILNPNRALRPGAKYTATVTTGAADLEGNALAEDEIWKFTVESRR